MKTIIARIENNNKGLYSVYFDSDLLPFSFIGDGFSIEDAKANFIEAYNEMRGDYYNETQVDIQVEFSFVLDMTALLYKYKKYITLVGLSELTGINKVQLSQYLRGERIPKKATEEKIKKAVISFAEELRCSFS